MISYSQNAEDVVLARALPAASGFYVDVGAGHPEIASVTKYFYDLGWHGMNIEPRSDAIALLNEQRPRDINLQYAAGAFDGTTELFVVDDDPDLSTIDRADLDYLRDRGHGYSGETVPVRTLNGLLEEHGVTAIDFLKVDVEGSEAEVLRGIDLVRWAPTVVVVECVLPWSRERNDATWRTILESQGYREAGFDGINLFFAAEHNAAVADLLSPASVLDEYETAAEVATREELERLRGYIAKLEDELARHEEWQRDVSGYIRSMETELGRSGHVAPVIDLRPARPEPAPAKRARPPAAARLAIVGTPQTGDDWIRTVLADALDAKELPAVHPGDVDWAGLPDRFVIQLHWPRSQFLERTFREHGVLVVSAARHPLDVLLSLLAHSEPDERLRTSGPGDPAFLDWATSPNARDLLTLTPQWWSTPATHRVRYEQLMADPPGELTALLDRYEITARKDPLAVVEDHPLAAFHALSLATPPGWPESLPTESADLLLATYRDVCAALGYER